MGKLILLRHGKSEWNKKNLFTGWVDVPLSPEGVEEAYQAGEKIKDVDIDVIFISKLVRAQMTAFLAMLKHNSKKIPCLVHDLKPPYVGWDTIHSAGGKDQVIMTYASEKLNERMYGDIQGMNKDDAREEFGKEQVHIWRRSFDKPPPNGESLELTKSPDNSVF